MEFQAVSGPKFTGLFSSNAVGISLVCTSFQFWTCCLVPQIFNIKVWSGPKLTEILHVFCPQIFLAEHPPPNFWSQFIKYSQIPIMWQSFRAIGRWISEKAWQKTSRIKHKPSRTTGSGLKKYNMQWIQYKNVITFIAGAWKSGVV